MSVKVNVTRQPQASAATPLASPPRYDEDRESEYEEQAAQEEHDQKVRDEYKAEMTDEVLRENGEEYTVWVSTDDPDIQEQIGNVARSLKMLVAAVVKDNQLPLQPEVMTEPERLQLITLLKAMIQELEGPFIDRGRSKGLGGWLKNLGKKAIEKKASEAIGSAIDTAQDEILNLNDKLASADGVENLTSMF